MKLRLGICAVIFINTVTASASVFDLESLTPIRVSNKYDSAVNSAKNALLKQTGISDFYKHRTRQFAAEYKRQTFDLIKDATGFEGQTVVGLAGFAGAAVINNSIDVSFKDTNNINYVFSIRKELLFTSFKIHF